MTGSHQHMKELDGKGKRFFVSQIIKDECGKLLCTR